MDNVFAHAFVIVVQICFANFVLHFYSRSHGGFFGEIGLQRRRRIQTLQTHMAISVHLNTGIYSDWILSI